MKMTDEMLKKAKNADSPEALLQLAEENGIEVSEEEAGRYFDLLHSKDGEISDEELNNVTGGGCGGDSGRPAPKFKIGSIVIVRPNSASLKSIEGQITKRCYSQGMWFYWLDADTFREGYAECDIKYVVALPE